MADTTLARSLLAAVSSDPRVLILETDADGRVDAVHGDPGALFGREAGAIVGAEIAALLRVDADALAVARDYRGPVACAHADGVDRHARATVAALLEEPARGGRLVVLEDDDEDHAARVALERDASLFEILGALNQVGGWDIDVQTMTPYFSPVTLALYGYEPGENIDLAAGIERYPEAVRDTITQAFNDAMVSGVPYDLEVPFIDVKGNHKWIRTAAQPIMVDGEVVRVCGTFQDITAQHRFHEEVQQLQKLDALGRLAAGIAHDFNNLLTAIGCAAESALMDVEDALSPVDSLRDVLLANERAGLLARKLLIFGRKQDAQVRTVSLTRLLEQLAPTLRRLVTERVEVVIEGTADPAYVNLDPVHLEQIVLNLVTNANHAMPEGGRLTLALDGQREAEATVVLRVRDEGVGMEPEVVSKIFEPFFSTKGEHGSGLGLAMVHGLTRQYQGSVEVESTPGRGTCFTLRFPRAAEPRPSPDRAEEPRRGLSGNERILVVDDDDTVRRLAVDALRRFGYRVREAASGDEALAAAAADPFELVLTDVVMPRMSGRELGRQLRERGFDGSIMLMSGYDPERAAADDAFAFLDKPFTPRQLVARVREILDQS